MTTPRRVPHADLAAALFSPPWQDLGAGCSGGFTTADFGRAVLEFFLDSLGSLATVTP